MSVELVWITPDAERLVAYMARVSNPTNQKNSSVDGLLRYMVAHKHWSPFEMVSACVEINTTRDIGRQILRHRSFSFQEFSQRYADTSVLPEPEFRECRLQDTKNRQNSLVSEDSDLNETWKLMQEAVIQCAQSVYNDALSLGIAKEQARAVLPEGLTPSRMYMVGNLRSWAHYCQLRCGPETQKEHRSIAKAIRDVLFEQLPITWAAVEGAYEHT